MDKLAKEVHRYRMQHGYPENEDELLRFAQHFVNWKGDTSPKKDELGEGLGRLKFMECAFCKFDKGRKEHYCYRTECPNNVPIVKVDLEKWK